MLALRRLAALATLKNTAGAQVRVFPPPPPVVSPKHLGAKC